MSRRDTIVIALLINAGLLALLFMLAVNVDDDTAPTERAPQMSTESSRPTAMNEIKVSDESDEFLTDLKTSNAPQSAYVDDEDSFIAKEPDSSEQQMPPDSSSKSLPTAKSDYIEVRVKSGDALEKIARNNNTTVEAIKQANNLTSTKLSIGQVLRIPTSSKSTSKPTTAAVAAPSKAVASTESEYYTVKPGDSPWKIAREVGTTVDELLKLNGLDEAKARNLKVGEKIRVR